MTVIVIAIAIVNVGDLPRITLVLYSSSSPRCLLWLSFVATVIQKITPLNRTHSAMRPSNMIHPSRQYLDRAVSAEPDTF